MVATKTIPLESTYRLWRAFLSARFLVATLLVALQISTVWYSTGVSSNDRWLWLITTIYWTISLLGWLGLHKKPPQPSWQWPWLLLLVADILCICLLQTFQQGKIYYAPLLALPVLTVSFLGTLRLALAVTSGITLILLGSDLLIAWEIHDLQGVNYMQTALVCTGFFAVAYLSHLLSQRLIEQTQQAQSHRLAAHMQAQVNSLIVAHLTEGVLVVDQDCRIKMANSNAYELLGIDHTAPVHVLDANPFSSLRALVLQTFANKQPLSQHIHFITDKQSITRLHARTWLTKNFHPADKTASIAATEQASSLNFHSPLLCVIFLHDLREIEARLRTEKMAAMGRMSGAVAHEIRNPLAAILQANALLAEELTKPLEQKLSSMIEQNAQRLARIAEDVLDIARLQKQVKQERSPNLAIDIEVGRVWQEWKQHHGLGQQISTFTPDCPNLWITFDSDHLRRVIINLLDNAAKHCQGSHPDSVQLSTQHHNNHVWLQVWSAGPPLEASVEKHLFEPFFSSQSRSTGLGLYICRELCMRHSASIHYLRCERSTSLGLQVGNAFEVHFQSDFKSPENPSLF